MSTIRLDRGHPLFRGGDFSSPENRPGSDAPSGSLSIVIPSKNEADNLSPLVEQVVQAFRPLLDRPQAGHRLDAFEVVVVDDGSTDETRSVLTPAGRERIRRSGRSRWWRTSGSRRRRSRGSGSARGTGSGCSTPTYRIPPTTWRGSGMLARVRRRPGMADDSRGLPVEAPDQPGREPGAQLRSRPIDQGYRLLGPDLPARSRVAHAGVPRGPSVLRPLAPEGGVPGGPGAGGAPPEDSWEVALPLRATARSGSSWTCWGSPGCSDGRSVTEVNSLADRADSRSSSVKSRRAGRKFDDDSRLLAGGRVSSGKGSSRPGSLCNGLPLRRKATR